MTESGTGRSTERIEDSVMSISGKGSKGTKVDKSKPSNLPFQDASLAESGSVQLSEGDDTAYLLEDEEDTSIDAEINRELAKESAHLSGNHTFHSYICYFML